MDKDKPMKTVNEMTLEQLRTLVLDIQTSVRHGKTFGGSVDIHNDVERALEEAGLDHSELSEEEVEFDKLQVEGDDR